MKRNIIGIDLGATSGRIILAKVGGGSFSYKEIHRFPNEIVEKEGKYYWDITKLYWEILSGLMMVGDMGVKVDSIGVDAWGVDFVYVGEDGEIIGNPRSYRDPYTKKAPQQLFKTISKDKIYDKTGIQILDFNTLFQLYAARKEKFEPLEKAKHILFIPDAISYMLTGKMVCEYSILSTSQLMNPRTKCLDKELLDAVGISEEMFPEIVMPGTAIGTLRKEIGDECGLGAVQVIAVAGHDTASAVAAVPAEDENFAYLSSGTWSLMGIETSEPIISEDSFRDNFTNEGGVNGSTRFLKNITGMWILERCMSEWAKKGKIYTHESIAQLMGKTRECISIIDVDDPLFANPKRMIPAIEKYCTNHQLSIPNTDAMFIRCIFDSLVKKYTQTLIKLVTLSPFPIDNLYIIGGGSKNHFLNQLIANAIHIPVIAGPAEATSIGNIMVQAKALGIVDSIWDIRDYVRNTVCTAAFLPE